jgi:hypothetical protein
MLSKEQISSILNEKKFSIRKLLNNPDYHNTKKAIPMTELNIEKEPQLSQYIEQLIPFMIKEEIFNVNYSEDELKQDWNNLVNKDITGDINVRSKQGHLILDMFMDHINEVQNYKGVSIRNGLTLEIWRKALYLTVSRHSTPYRSEIRKNIAMALGLSTVTKYRAITAKKLCCEYNAHSVLDPCIGWGGRMLGTICLGSRYVGCEPDVKTFGKLEAILGNNSIPIENRSMATIINKPFETGINDIIASGEMFDMVLTSPPYFNLEIYTSGEQSTDTFSTWETWVVWLRETILSCLARINEGGTSCWSVKNIKTDKKYQIADITEKIHNEAGWKLVRTICVSGSSRTGTSKKTEEYTYVFKQV